jgi:hypothetical protein
MIKLTVISTTHFVISGDEPYRTETTIQDGKAITFVYRGAEVNLDDEPVGMFDGTSEDNLDWEVY